MTTRKLVKRLPLPVVRLLQSAYERWYSAVRIDRRMTCYLAEYFGVTFEQAVCLLKVGTRLNKEIWDILCPKSDEEIIQFYRVNPFYIFSLAYWHMSRAQRRFRREVVRLAKGHVLDYGGGIGDLSVALAQAGLKVTYCDIGGRTFDFARWFIERHGLTGITMLDAERDWEKKMWDTEYDTVICIDVIEHVCNPKQLLERIAASLRANGILIITGFNSATHHEHPMHLPITFDPKGLLESLGLYQSQSRDWLWIKKPLDREEGT